MDRNGLATGWAQENWFSPSLYPPPGRRFAEEGVGETVRLSRCLPRPLNLCHPSLPTI